MTAEFRNCEAMLCAFRNFITDRSSQSAGAGIRASIFISCNAATVRTQEVPLMHAPCYSIARPTSRKPYNARSDCAVLGLLAVVRVGNFICGRATYQDPCSLRRAHRVTWRSSNSSGTRIRTYCDVIAGSRSNGAKDSQRVNSLGTEIANGAVIASQHRNPRTFPIESLAHDSGRTSVRGKYGYPKGYPNTNSYRRNPPLQLSIQCSPQRTRKQPSSEPHWATRQQQAIAEAPSRWSACHIPSVIVVFVVLVLRSSL
jgi:hypothetical protein